jgi:hypothetical protein
MSKIGRPTKLNIDVANRILDALRLGVPQSTATAYAGISRSTYYRWLAVADDSDAPDEFRDFRDAVRTARAEAEVRSIAVIQNASDRSWQAAAWFLERSFPEHWARKDRHEITGNDGRGIELSVDVEALDLKLRRLIAERRGEN